MIKNYNALDDIASKIDVGLCDTCRMVREMDEHDEDPLRVRQPSEVTAVLLNQVRRDIGNLAAEVRSGFSALELRVRELELKDAKSEGAIAGVKGTMAVVATVCSLAGGVVGWIISWFVKK